jgi:hypothetical protein
LRDSQYWGKILLVGSLASLLWCDDHKSLPVNSLFFKVLVPFHALLPCYRPFLGALVYECNLKM